MYQPAAFRETDPSVLFATIRQHPLATLITHGSDGLAANEIPCLLEVRESEHGGPPQGVLRAHLARANPQWRALAQTQAAAQECLLIFHGPQAYVSPNWYATKAQTHKAVPTWNYVAIQARGVPRVIDDPAWLRELVEALTREHESSQPWPWQLTDAPEDFIDAMCRAIVGVEIPIARLEGKFKVSQNRTEADRAGVATGLQAQTPPRTDMARLVRGER